MAKVGKTSDMGGVRHTGVIHVIQDSDTGCPAVRVVVVVAVRRDDEGGGWHPCGVPTSDRGEVGEAAGRRGMGDTSG